jgi:hypothetical protein
MQHIDPKLEASVKAQCLEMSHRYVKDIPEWQHEANAEFFLNIWKSLTMGGIYGWPNTRRIFKKIPTGWVEVTPSE